MLINSKRIALFGNFGSDNLGNEASLKAILDLIRRSRPHDHVTCICRGVARAQEEHGVVAVPMKLPLPDSRWFVIVNRLLAGLPFRFIDFMRALRLARSIDVFIVPGTGILDDFGERWQGMPYELFKWGITARLCRRKFAFISVGAGPIVHPISRWLMISAARMASYRSYRDIASRDYMRALGVFAQEDPIFPDLAFNLAAPQVGSNELRVGWPATIGVGVMHYYGWNRNRIGSSRIHETYIDQVTHFIRWLLQQGYNVRLLMGAASDEQSFHEVMQRLVSQCDERVAARIRAEPAHSLHELMCQIGETELIVASRFHNIVAALKVGRPVISVGYAEKNDALLEQVGLGTFCQPIEKLDVTRLITEFQSLFQERDQFGLRIRGATEEFRRCLAVQDAHLLETLL